MLHERLVPHQLLWTRKDDLSIPIFPVRSDMPRYIIHTDFALQNTFLKPHGTSTLARRL